MPVTDKMKSALRRTAGLQSSGGAPFNAASQGGYRNMAKQISGGASMSPRGLARAQQGVGTPTRSAPITADDTTREAAGQALQRLSTGPAATDAMAGRGMGGTVQTSPPVYRSGAAAGQMQATSPMVDRQLSTSPPVVPEIDTSMTRQLAGGMGGIGAINTGAAAGQLQAPSRFAGLETELAAANAGKLAGLGSDNYGLPSLGAQGEPVSAATGEAVTAGPDRGAGVADATPFTGPRSTPGAGIAAYQDTQGAGAGAQDTGDMVEQTIRDLLMGGLRDTTSEENLVREMTEAQQQQALVDQRARAGRAGLVQTGAQAGIESDIRQRAAQQALRDIMGIQAEARGERRADVGLAGQLYGTDAALAAEEARTGAMLQALEQMYGADNTGDLGPGAVPGAIDDLGDLGIPADQVGKGNIGDRLSTDNTRQYSYTGPNGEVMVVYQRPNGSYFYQDETPWF